mmetsp:Transcript_23779/g.80325  ORF Transcript_23779/g.80325 Transcript_23779/m.80325 type:complete len:222 (-) Transcript_23779:658-1323(-)
MNMLKPPFRFSLTPTTQALPAALRARVRRWRCRCPQMSAPREAPARRGRPNRPWVHLLLSNSSGRQCSRCPSHRRRLVVAAGGGAGIGGSVSLRPYRGAAAGGVGGLVRLFTAVAVNTSRRNSSHKLPLRRVSHSGGCQGEREGVGAVDVESTIRLSRHACVIIGPIIGRGVRVLPPWSLVYASGVPPPDVHTVSPRPHIAHRVQTKGGVRDGYGVRASSA